MTCNVDFEEPPQKKHKLQKVYENVSNSQECFDQTATLKDIEKSTQGYNFLTGNNYVYTYTSI